MISVRLSNWISQLSVVLGLITIACGGTGSDADRKAAAAAKTASRQVFNDPGSLFTYSCEADQPSGGITTHILDDWEMGAGTGWYTNNDRCESCQADMDAIKAAAPDKASKVASDGYLFDAGALDAGLNDLRACMPDCIAAQVPSYFDKPVPADKIPGARCGSVYAFHVESGPFTKWGGQLGRTFNPPVCVTDTAANPCPTDSAPVPGGPYDGIAFWARVAPGSGTGMRVQVGESHTDIKYPEPGDAGPPCVDQVGIVSPNDTSQGCDAFGTFTSLNTNWQFFTMPFEEMRQAGWGKRAPFFDIQHISNLTFFYAQGIWDIWIDDISFYRRGPQ